MDEWFNLAKEIVYNEEDYNRFNQKVLITKDYIEELLENYNKIIKLRTPVIKDNGWDK